MKDKAVPKTMFKTVDWGGATIVNLLAVYAFPPYFVYLMTLAALTASGFWWTHRLMTQAEQERFIEFEREFRKGYKLEKSGNAKAAIAWYQKLEKRYAELPQAHKLASLQIKSLRVAKPAQSPKGKKPFPGQKP